MKRFNRLWALLLSLALLLTYMPAMAFAEDAEGVDSDALSNEQMAEEDGSQEAVAENPAGEASDTAAPEASAPEKKEEPSEVNANSTAPKKSSGGAKNVDLRGAEGEFTVTYNANGGHFIRYDDDGNEVDLGETIEVTCDEDGYPGPDWDHIEREGYAMIGWSLTSDGEEISGSIYDSVEEDTIYYVLWSKVPVVTFDMNGGYYKKYNDDTEMSEDVTEPLKVNCEDRGDLGFFLEWVPNWYYRVQRDGYSLSGWSETENGEPVDLYDDETGNYLYHPTEDVTLYAVWTEADAVIFDANGGKFIDESGNEFTEKAVSANEYGEVYELSDRPVYDGDKAFDGWYWDTKFTRPVDFESEGCITLEENSGHVRVYAKWVSAYTATFDAGSGGYFDGDESKTTKTLKLKKNSVIDWDDVEYYISMALTETGRNIFNTWKYNGQEIDVYEDFVMDSDKTFTAEYKTGYLLTYNANGRIFDLDDESEDKAEIVTVVYKNSTISAPDWDLSNSTDGMVLMGWALEPDSEELINTDTYIVSKDTVLYAVWGNKLDIKLDPNGGVFKDEWGDDSTEPQTIDSAQGQTLDIFAPATDESGHEIFSFNFDQTPEKENQAFCGWFYDSACTDPVEKGTIITAEIINDHDGTLTLYAGYTEDYKEVVLDANGGTFGASGTEQLNLKVPEGLAVDVTNYNPYKDNDEDERMELSGWYYDSTCSQNNRVEMIDDKLFIPTESGRTLFARWLEPLDKEYINLKLKKSSGVLYSDDTEFSATATLTSSEYEMSEFTPIYEFQLGMYNDDDEFVPFVNSSEHKYYTVSGNKITINGKVVRTTFESEFIEDEQLYLLVKAFDKTTGRELKNTAAMINYYDPYTYLDFVNNYDNAEILIGYTGCITSQGEGIEYSKENPRGRSFEYTITKVVPAGNGDGPFMKAEDIGGEFDITAQKPGKEKVTVYYKDPGYTKTKKKVITLNAVKDSFEDLNIVQVSEPDTNGYIIKGMSLSFKTEVKQETAEGYEPGSYTIEWSLNNDSLLSLETDESTGTATVTFKEDAKFDPDEYNETILTAVLKDDNGESRRTSEYTLNPCEQFFTVENLPVIDDYLAINQYLEFNPTVIRYAADTGIEGEPVDDPTFAIYSYDEFELFDMEGNAIGTEERFNGPFKIKRKSGDSIDVEITVVDEYDNTAGYGKYKIPALLDLREEGIIKAIPDKTYTKGQQIKPTVVVTYEGKKLELNTDYTVTYGTNVNVGSGKVTVKGKGRYYGSISKTFKINPKRTTLKTLTPASKAITVTWNKQSAKMRTERITGYQIQYSTSSTFKSGNKTVTVAGYTKVSKKITKLRGKKKYYVRIRTYKTKGSKKYYSPWSSKKAVTTKQ